MPKRYLLTGGSWSGKTTMIKALNEKGFNIMPEAYELIVKEEIKNKGFNPDLENKINFIEIVLKKRIELESKNIGGEMVFIDRGIPDCMAYYKLHDKSPSKEYVNAVKNFRYDKVFFLSLLDNYETDNIRIEDQKTREIVHGLLEETYKELDYKLIYVPVIPIKDKIKFIEKHIY